MTQIILSTRNRHKVQEIRDLLPDPFQILTLSDFADAPQVVEDADSFAGNATKKAVQLAAWLARGAALRAENSSPPGARSYVLADDSGLEVDALNGAPGVQSARFAAIDTGRSGNSSDAENNAKLLRLLQSLPPEKRTARFRCVIALVPLPALETGNPAPACSRNKTEFRAECFEGVCEGRIGYAPSGQGGFGYDPLFVPEGLDRTFAELGEQVKNRISHRARALLKLRERLVRE